MACGGAQVPEWSEPPTDDTATRVLWLPAGAEIGRDLARPVVITNGRSLYIDGSSAVNFGIAMECQEFARLATAHFAGTEWRPRATDFVNPRHPTSFRAGCRFEHEPYMTWHGQWENADGDIVEYHLGGIGATMRGSASYRPRHVVESSLRKLGLPRTPR